MMHRSLRNAGWQLLAGCGLLLAGPAQAAPPRPDSAVSALARLSAADLNTARPKGAALFARLFRDAAEKCDDNPTGVMPRFSRLCSWVTHEDAEFPELMVGMNGTRIVSVWTAYDRLDKAIWSCRPAIDGVDNGEVKLCHVKTASPAMREQWTRQWRQYLNSIN